MLLEAEYASWWLTTYCAEQFDCWTAKRNEQNNEQNNVKEETNCAETKAVPTRTPVASWWWNPDVVGRFPDHVILAPYPDMEPRIALTAWRRIDTMDAFDEKRILKFIRAYRGADHHATF